METVWKFASRLFTVSFPAFLLGTLLSEQLSGQWGTQLAVGLTWFWLAAAGLVSAVGWYAILWNPIPASAWKAFVFITANVVFWAFSSFGLQRAGRELAQQAFSGNLLFCNNPSVFLIFGKLWEN